MTINQFISFVDSHNIDKNKPVKMLIYPKTGWEFELHAYITHIISEIDYVFLTNAFDSIIARHLNTNEIIDFLNLQNKELPIVFEIYGMSKEGTNEQIIIEKADLEKMQITEDPNFVYFKVSVDFIHNVNNI